MALVVDQHEREGVVILALAGSLTMGSEDAVFRTVVQSRMAAGNSRIVLGFDQLRSIDSAGLATLVYLQLQLRRAGGKAVLLNVARTQMELLVLAKLEVIFEVFTDEVDAVYSFFPERAIKHYDILEFVEEENGQQDAGVSTTRSGEGYHN